MARPLRLALLATIVAFAVVATASASRPVCTHGVSSIGPITLVGGHLHCDTKPRTEACLPLSPTSPAEKQ